MGFLVQARDAKTDAPAGTFVLINEPDEPFRMQHLGCDDNQAEASVTHTDNDPKSAMKVQYWTKNAPTMIFRLNQINF